MCFFKRETDAGEVTLRPGDEVDFVDRRGHGRVEHWDHTIPQPQGKEVVQDARGRWTVEPRENLRRR